MKETVAVVRCPDYSPENVVPAVARVLEICGVTALPAGLLLKPNMLSARPPEAGVTTHPAVLEAVCRAAGPGSLVGDSPANSRKDVREYWDACAYTGAAARGGARLVRFDRARTVEIGTGRDRVKVPLAEEMFRHPLFNLPKLKTHNLTLVTGPVKNFYGLIPGYYKSILHSRFMNVDDFSRLLARLYLEVRGRVCFNLVDAVTVMEGDGPAAGRPRHAGFLIGGRDAVACEIACARLLGLPARDLPVLRALEDIGQPLPDITVAGDSCVPLENFLPPSSFDLVRFLSRPGMASLNRLLGRCFRITPRIDPAACRRCGRCREVCPVSAVSASFAVLRPRCINCLCCFEVCPHEAVKLRKSLVARLFR